MHQLPSSPSNIRVRVWRRLQQLGALVVKQAVYVLPDSPDAREDFEWLKSEIEGAGGQAGVFSADSVDTWSDDALVEEFRRARQADYTALSREIEVALARVSARRGHGRSRSASSQRMVEVFRQRATAIERIDFFGSAGRDRVVGQLDQLTMQVSSSPHDAHETRHDNMATQTYRRRLWVTRPRPGVDRMASAWLIGRFIDPDARFGFVPDHDAAPPEAVPFDMFGVEFSHHGEHCTFETLCKRFGITDSSVSRLAAIVHDLDLKDERFGSPEAPTVSAVIEGLQLAHDRDDVLLKHGVALFDSLYRAFHHSAKRAGPRALAKPRKSAASKKAPSSRRRRAP